MKVKVIKVAMGVTINLGDFQFARFDVGLEAEDDGSGFDQAKVLVAQRLDSMVKEFGLVNPMAVETKE